MLILPSHNLTKEMRDPPERLPMNNGHRAWIDTVSWLKWMDRRMLGKSIGDWVLIAVVIAIWAGLMVAACR